MRMSKGLATTLASMLLTVNNRNKVGVATQDSRVGANSLLEQMLMEADCYAGFGYYNSGEVPQGHRPGIRHWFKTTDREATPDEFAAECLRSVQEQREMDITHTFPDPSRCHYYLDRKLVEAYRELEARSCRERGARS